MACNSCAKSYSLLRKEKGCPSCGFSYCSKCLDNKVFVPKLKSEAKVCAKCKRTLQSNESSGMKVEPPDAYYKRLAHAKSTSLDDHIIKKPMDELSETDQQIQERLKKLREANIKVSEGDIKERLNKLKGDIPTASDDELRSRLANLRGVPVTTLQSKPLVIQPDQRSEQEQADDLMKQYFEQSNMDSQYKDEFNELVSNMEARLGKLKDGSGPSREIQPGATEADNEEEEARKIVEKIKSAVTLEQWFPTSGPWTTSGPQ